MVVFTVMDIPAVEVVVTIGDVVIELDTDRIAVSVVDMVLDTDREAVGVLDVVLDVVAVLVTDAVGALVVVLGLVAVPVMDGVAVIDVALDLVAVPVRDAGMVYDAVIELVAEPGLVLVAVLVTDDVAVMDAVAVIDRVAVADGVADGIGGITGMMYTAPWLLLFSGAPIMHCEPLPVIDTVHPKPAPVAFRGVIISSSALLVHVPLAGLLYKYALLLLTLPTSMLLQSSGKATL
jgi:hypothetical protein